MCSDDVVRDNLELYDLELMFDGDCPLCVREMRMLERMDRSGRLRLTDLTTATVEQTVGRTHAELMERMHGRLPDGTWVEGVEVFRRAYAAVGFRRLVAMSRWPLIRNVLDVCYAVFARNRLRLTGRCDDGTCAVS